MSKRGHEFEAKHEGERYMEEFKRRRQKTDML